MTLVITQSYKQNLESNYNATDVMLSIFVVKPVMHCWFLIMVSDYHVNNWLPPSISVY